jgi:hypothetical protein
MEILKEFEGKVLENVTYNKEDEILTFYFTNGDVYEMFHEQDCCESVYLEDGYDDLMFLIGQEILQAYVTSNSGDDDGGTYTYTYYNISTFLNSATLRWYGSSNGYYSEAVDIQKVG